MDDADREARALVVLHGPTAIANVAAALRARDARIHELIGALNCYAHPCGNSPDTGCHVCQVIARARKMPT